MKRILLLLHFVFFAFFVQAQQDKSDLAMQLVSKNSAAIGLSQEQLANLTLSSTYYNDAAGTQMVYLLQTHKGLPIYNQMLVLAFKNEKLVSNAGKLITSLDSVTQHQSALPSLNAESAVRAAFAETKLPVPGPLSRISSTENGHKLDFGKNNSVSEKIMAELMWLPVEKGNKLEVKLAWQIQVVPVGKSDWWNIQIDAATGAVIAKVNLTVYEHKGGKSDDYISLFRPQGDRQNGKLHNKEVSSALKFMAPPPPTVTSASYRVVPYPLESPNYGPDAVVTNPWLLSGVGSNATTNGWHFDGTNNYDITRGNNVFAYLDASNNNTPGAATNWPDTSTTANPSLSFTQVPITTQQPTTTINKKFALNNLFYWNNLMHDVFYQYGFNEVSGNFQTDNI